MAVTADCEIKSTEFIMTLSTRSTFQEENSAWTAAGYVSTERTNEKPIALLRGSSTPLCDGFQYNTPYHIIHSSVYHAYTN